MKINKDYAGVKLFKGFLAIRDKGKLVTPENVYCVIKEQVVDKIKLYARDYAEIHFKGTDEYDYFYPSKHTIPEWFQRYKNAKPEYNHDMNNGEWYEEEYVEYFGMAKDAETVKKMMIKELQKNLKKEENDLEKKIAEFQNELNKIKNLNNYAG